MKSLILKDYYNIKNHIRQFLVVMALMGLSLFPSLGAEGFIVCCAIMTTMLTVTTFSIDERCMWEKYALIMPVSRKDYVRSKYIISWIFGGCGLAIGGLSSLIFGSKEMQPMAILLSVMTGIALNLIATSIFIPCILRFGSENARIIMIGSAALPSLVIFIVYKAMLEFNIVIPKSFIFLMIGVVVIGIPVISYKLSLKWFSQKEF